MRNGFKFLKQVKSKTSQFEIVFKLLASSSTQFRVKESFKLLILYNLRKFGDKSRNNLVKNLLILAGRAGEYGPLN